MNNSKSTSLSEVHSRHLSMRFLALLGVLPFAVASACIVLGVQSVFGLSPTTLLSSYALLIGAFMAGVHWGQQLNTPADSNAQAATITQQCLHLQLTSNGIALVFWFGYVLLPVTSYLVFAAVLFAILACIDWRLYRVHQWITRDYWITRCLASAGVVIFLLLAWCAL